MKKKLTCEHCGQEHEVDVCDQCLGKGVIYKYRNHIAVSFSDCSYCNGTGPFVVPGLHRVLANIHEHREVRIVTEPSKETINV